MKLLRNVHMILFMLILVSIVSLAAYAKSPSIFATKEVQTSTTVAVKPDLPQIDKQKKLVDQKKSEELAKVKAEQLLKHQKKLSEDLKFNKQQELESKQKVQEQQKTKALEAQKNQKVTSKQEKSAPQKQIISSKKETSSSIKTPVATPIAVPKPKLLIDKINGKGNAHQAIIVTTNSPGSISVTITTFEKANGTWRQVSSFAGNIGRTSFTYNKVEGDGHSPIGIFSLGTAFGRYVNPGTSMNYKKSTTNDFWVDDVNSSLYNTWQQGPASKRWNSAENMYIPQYNYGFIINHNTTSRTPGKGSAIFFHVWSGPGHGTAGCTSASQNNVIRTLKWLKPSKSPIIIQGTMSDVLKM